MLGHVGVGSGDDDSVGAQVGQGGPDLLAVEDPLVAVALGPGLQAGHVGAGTWLGEHLAPHVLAGDVAGQVGRLLAMGAVLGQHGQAHPVGDEQVVGHVGVAAALLAPSPVVGLGQSGAAVLRGVREPREAGGGEGLLEALSRPQAQFAQRVGVPVEVDAGGVLIEEGPAAGPERFVLGSGEGVVVHGPLSVATRRSVPRPRTP